MKTLSDQLKEILEGTKVKESNVEETLADIFHDLRREMEQELDLLFDKVDDGYAHNEYYKEILIEAIKEMKHARGLLKIIRESL
jgi:hypothetical protein